MTAWICSNRQGLRRSEELSDQIQPRSFKPYAVVEALRGGSIDIRSAIVPFFLPILAFENGAIFDALKISQKVNEAYHWNIVPEIVEGFIPEL